MALSDLPNRWISVDPGESVGWALWEKEKLITAGTGELWAFGDSVFRAVFGDALENELMDDELAVLFDGIELMVVEDFRIYPWVAKAGGLNFDPVRTARLIGAFTIIGRQSGIPMVLQPAKIKERAEAAGAERLFYAPLNENRHANDAMRHGVYYVARASGMAPILEDTEENGK
jgi:hypothetical protein